MSVISIASINIEFDRHENSVTDFLLAKKPDIALLQECPRSFGYELAERCGYAEVLYAPMLRCSSKRRPGENDHFGVAILSRIKPSESAKYYYVGSEDELPPIPTTACDIRCRVVIVAEFQAGGSNFVVGVTHFSWTPDGSTSDDQRKDLKRLLGFLEAYPELILCGDFNAPRGGEIHAKLATIYTDNIPTNIVSTLDPELHYSKGSVDRVVDHVLTTPGYKVSSLELNSGVSDHLAINFTVESVK